MELFDIFIDLIYNAHLSLYKATATQNPGGRFVAQNDGYLW